MALGVKNTTFNFFCLGVAGTGISGGDRIFIEFARNWSKTYKVNIYTSFEGKKLLTKSKLNGKNINVIVIPNSRFKDNFVLNYIFKILYALFLGANIRLDTKSRNVLYSASNFWMDAFPAFILRFRFQKSVWLATWYMSPPNPLRGYKEGHRKNSYRLRALYFWVMLSVVKPLVSFYADAALVNNEEERKQFVSLSMKNRVHTVIGAVDLIKINQYLRDHKKTQKKYECVYQGRFHPQKGVEELVDIWRLVVDKRSNARLAMIGDGPLMNSVKHKIREYKLQKNIKLFGYVFDGDKKYSIFSSSKIVVHPAYYDSGGMAAAEAMAFGLPCVGYNLKAYESYYPKGMVKVEIDDKKAFSERINKLLNDQIYYKKISKEGMSMIAKYWGWKTRSNEILNFVNEIQI